MTSQPHPKAVNRPRPGVSGLPLRALAPGLWHWLREFALLHRRYWLTKKADSSYWGMAAIQVPLIAFLLVLVFRTRDSDIRALLFCLAISAHWFGLFSAVRELVSERSLYQRERLLGLRITTYLFSRVPLLTGIAFLQSATLLALTWFFLLADGAGFVSNLARAAAMLWILCLTSAVGVALGLALSALALILGRKTAGRGGMLSSEVAMSLVPIAVLPQVVLGGPFYFYSNALPLAQFLSKLTPARWSLIALTDIEGSTLPESMQAWFGVRGDAFALTNAVLLCFAAGLILATVGLMNSLDRREGGRRKP